ncbi:MAG: hypothetical protein H7326_08560 [Bdellovibrionaceae bacterium]|nr:hypothetical protein [Pseudobdellovibrionaceae bacterium]
MVCSGINLQVQIENYKIADCKGKVYSEDKILATTLLGAVGGSKTLAGATDIDVKMNPDIF